MNKISKAECPELFENIGDAVIEDSRVDHRRGANFFVQSVVEFKEEHAKYYPTIDLTPFIGTWETNTYIRDDNSGSEWDEINTLTRVEKNEIIITKKVWEPVK
jgi:hypothetical protein